jgi:hypothetical protein
MGLGSSLFLIAIGAILRFAVTASVRGLNIHTIGLILMLVGIAGLLISLLWMTIWTDRRRRVGVDEEPVVERRVYR